MAAVLKLFAASGIDAASKEFKAAMAVTDTKQPESAAVKRLRASDLIPSLSPLLTAVASYICDLPRALTAIASAADAAVAGAAVDACVRTIRFVRNSCALAPAHQNALRTTTLSSTGHSIFQSCVHDLIPACVQSLTATYSGGGGGVLQPLQSRVRDLCAAVCQCCVNAIVQNSASQAAVFDWLLQPAAKARSQYSAIDSGVSFVHAIITRDLTALQTATATATASATGEEGESNRDASAETVFSLLCSLLYNCVIGSERRSRALLWDFDDDEEGVTGGANDRKAAPAKSTTAVAATATRTTGPDHIAMLRSILAFELSLHPHVLLSDRKSSVAPATVAEAVAGTHDHENDPDTDDERGSAAFHSIVLIWRQLLSCTWSHLIDRAWTGFRSNGSESPEWLLVLRIIEIHTREPPPAGADLSAVSDHCRSLCTRLVQTLAPRAREHLFRTHARLIAAAAGDAKSVDRTVSPVLTSTHYIVQILGNVLSWHHTPAFITALTAAIPPVDAAAPAQLATAVRTASSSGNAVASSGTVSTTAGSNSDASTKPASLDALLLASGMRMMEWYGWHFPELNRIINPRAPDASEASPVSASSVFAYASVLHEFSTRAVLSSTDAEERFARLIASGAITSEVAQEIKAAGEVSMGTDISDVDVANITRIADQILLTVRYQRAAAAAATTTTATAGGGTGQEGVSIADLAQRVSAISSDHARAIAALTPPPTAAASAPAKSAATAPAPALPVLPALPQTLVEAIVHSLQWCAGQFQALPPSVQPSNAAAAATPIASASASSNTSPSTSSTPASQAGAFGMGVGRRLDPINDHLPYAFRVDLMRVLANLVFQQTAIAEQLISPTVSGAVSDSKSPASPALIPVMGGGIETIMNHTYIDSHEPLLREWSVFALRNAIEASPDRVAARVREYQLSGISADTQEQLSRIGMKVSVTPASTAAGADGKTKTTSAGVKVQNLPRPPLSG